MAKGFCPSLDDLWGLRSQLPNWMKQLADDSQRASPAKVKPDSSLGNLALELRDLPDKLKAESGRMRSLNIS